MILGSLNEESTALKSFCATRGQEQKGTGLRIRGQVGWESPSKSKSKKSRGIGEKQPKGPQVRVLSRIQTRLRGFSRWHLPLLCHPIPNLSLQAESNCKGISIQSLAPNYVKFMVAINPDSETSPVNVEKAPIPSYRPPAGWDIRHPQLWPPPAMLSCRTWPSCPAQEP